MDKSENNIYLLIICVLGPFLILLLLNVSDMYYMKDVKNIAYFKRTLNIINVATLVLTALSIISINRLISVLKAEVREKHLQESIAQFEGLMGSISKERHDFNNHMQMLCALIEMEQIQDAKDYIYSIVNENSLHNEVIKTNNVGISAILHSKLASARSKGIETDLCLNGDFRSLPLEPLEITSILGNLIDNSIDALENTPLQGRKISLSIDRNKYSLMISISNNIDGKVKESSGDIFKKGYSTKGSSGLGLYIVKEIVERHKGHIESKISSNTITFTIIIPVII